MANILTNSFNEHISYVGANSSPCYNGNISNITWQNGHNNLSRGYNFTYDGLNRMANATYQEGGNMSSGANKYNEDLEYDENGNPTHVKRNGKMQDGNFGAIDNLKLTYHGNQLLTVDDTAPMNLNEGAFDFKNNSKYQYDGTGALITNSGKGIAYIEYTDGNMPKRIQFTNGNVTSYVYTSIGQKLRTIHYTAVPNITVAIGSTHNLCNEEILFKDSTDYIMDGELILKNGKVDMYCFDGGFCSLDNNNGRKQGLYYYNKDHLDNNREVVAADGTIAQTNNYYPFGTPFNEGTSSSSELQPYKYNGKELDRMHGLDIYDYGARQMEPVICQWTAVDPLSEKYYNISPYVYCANNPINSIDPDGKMIVCNNHNAVYYNAKSKRYVTNKYADASTRTVVSSLSGTNKGKQMLKMAVLTPTEISFNISSEKSIDGDQFKFGTSNVHTTRIGKSGYYRNREYYVKVEITIYKGTIEEDAANNKIKHAGLTTKQAIGAVAGHEITHVADPTEVEADLNYEKTHIDENTKKPIPRDDTEVKANKVESIICDQSLKK
mgnify:FL=1